FVIMSLIGSGVPPGLSSARAESVEYLVHQFGSPPQRIYPDPLVIAVHPGHRVGVDGVGIDPVCRDAALPPRASAGTSFEQARGDRGLGVSLAASRIQRAKNVGIDG